MLVVGVNGVGKTTTIGKFARFLRSYDRTVVVGAADTFRAAAVDQLATWAERAGVAIVRPAAARARIRHPSPSRPSSTPSRTAPRSCIIDTAGRLHTKGGLMDELGKIRRVIEKQAPISEVLLVLDATTGQNGARCRPRRSSSTAASPDSCSRSSTASAKGGFVLAVQEKTGLPIKLIGQGEGIGDLTGFTPHVFAQKLVG